MILPTVGGEVLESMSTSKLASFYELKSDQIGNLPNDNPMEGVENRHRP